MRPAGASARGKEAPRWAGGVPDGFARQANLPAKARAGGFAPHGLPPATSPEGDGMAVLSEMDTLPTV